MERHYWGATALTLVGAGMTVNLVRNAIGGDLDDVAWYGAALAGAFAAAWGIARGPAGLRFGLALLGGALALKSLLTLFRHGLTFDAAFLIHGLAVAGWALLAAAPITGAPSRLGAALAAASVAIAVGFSVSTGSPSALSLAGQLLTLSGLATLAWADPRVDADGTEDALAESA